METKIRFNQNPKNNFIDDEKINKNFTNLVILFTRFILLTLSKMQI